MAQIYIDGIGWIEDGGALGGASTPAQQAAIGAGYDPTYAGAAGVGTNTPQYVDTGVESPGPGANPNGPAPYYVDGIGWVDSTSYPSQFQGQANLIDQNASTNNGIFSTLEGWQTGAFAAQNGLGADSQALAQSGRDTANWLGGQNAIGIGQSWNSTFGANAADQQSLGQYTGALQSATNWDLGNYGQFAGDLGQAQNTATGAYSTLQQQAGGFSQLQARGYGADVQSQAQYAQADPASIAAQNQALSQLQGAANGSLNVTSQAAQAYADAGDVANQRGAADALQGIANGSKDVDFWGINGINDLHAVANGSKDIHVGQEDPEAYAAQKDALGQFSTLTNPEVTAQERFIYEQARQQQEQDERANREAVMTNYRQRGMSGSGMEIGSAALANQQTSQNRLLSDLGAQSTAVQRAMTALQGYGGLSSTMVNEADQVAAQNQGTQAAATAQFAGLGTQVAVGNKDRQAAAQQAASQAYAVLRAQGFSEEYARGQAADIVASANSDRQLNAMNASGNLASNMRNESFNEDFSTKSAADNMAQFNKSQSQITQRFQDQYAADQQNAAWGRDTDVAAAGEDTARTLTGIADTRFQGANTVGRNFAQDAGSLFLGQTGVTDAADRRIQGSVKTAADLNAGTADGQFKADALGIGANTQLSDTYAQQLEALTRLGLGHVDANNTTTGQKIGLIQTGIGHTEGTAAADAAKAAADSDPGGLLGTGILGKNDPLSPGNWFRGKLG